MTRREARRKGYEAAVRSGNRAYTFRDTSRGKEEVRVWPDGTVTYTKVDGRGVPTAGPRKAWTREGGLRANFRVSPTLALGVAVTGLVLERLV